MRFSLLRNKIFIKTRWDSETRAKDLQDERNPISAALIVRFLQAKEAEVLFSEMAWKRHPWNWQGGHGRSETEWDEPTRNRQAAGLRPFIRSFLPQAFWRDRKHYRCQWMPTLDGVDNMPPQFQAWKKSPSRSETSHTTIRTEPPWIDAETNGCGHSDRGRPHQILNTLIGYLGPYLINKWTFLSGVRIIFSKVV